MVKSLGFGWECIIYVAYFEFILINMNLVEVKWNEGRKHLNKEMIMILAGFMGLGYNPYIFRSLF